MFELKNGTTYPIHLGMMTRNSYDGNKEALLYLRYPSYKIIDDRYVVINNISSLAKFSIFVLNNQHNWDFIYEKKKRKGGNPPFYEAVIPLDSRFIS